MDPLEPPLDDRDIVPPESVPPISAEDLPAELRGLELGGGVLLTIGEDPLPGEELDGERRLPDVEPPAGDSAPVALAAAGAGVVIIDLNADQGNAAARCR